MCRAILFDILNENLSGHLLEFILPLKLAFLTKNRKFSWIDLTDYKVLSIAL